VKRIFFVVNAAVAMDLISGVYLALLIVIPKYMKYSTIFR
jgi:hypothetical protein